MGTELAGQRQGCSGHWNTEGVEVWQGDAGALGRRDVQRSRRRAPAMPNGRCRLHGGKSTGPRTAEGLERCRRAKWKHGSYCKQTLEQRRRVRELLRSSKQFLAELSTGNQ